MEFDAENGIPLNTIGGNLRITNGIGGHINRIIDTNVGGRVTIINGPSGPSRDQTFTVFAPEDSATRLSVGGDFVVESRGGRQFVRNELGNTDVAGNVRFHTSGAGPATHEIFVNEDFGSATITGNVLISSPQAKETIVSVGEGADSTTAALQIRGQLTIETGAADDTLNLTGFSVEGRALIRTNAGNDTVHLADAMFLSDLGVDTADGNDRVRIQYDDSPSRGVVQFLRSATIETGNGDDFLGIGAMDRPNSVQSARTSVLNGGRGTDRLDARLDVGRETRFRRQLFELFGPEQPA